MEKISIEVCLISARGLPRSPLWKLQWFAVGWIYPDDKYCTKIASSGNGSPIWKTKFGAVVDTSSARIQELALHVEVYSREPFFLREKFQGMTTVELKEFFANPENITHESRVHEHKGSFELRGNNSDKPRGFIDVSARILMKRDTTASYPGQDGFKLNNDCMSLETETRSTKASPEELPIVRHRPNGRTPSMNYPYIDDHSMEDWYQPFESGLKSVQPSTPPPPPPPPPLNVGFIPTLFPRVDSHSTAYMNMAPIQGSGGPDIKAGLGAGALAAGAMIFGDDFLSGFDYPVTRHSLGTAADPP